MSIGEEDAAFKARDLFGVKSAVDRDFVRLVHAITRMRQAIGELTIVGEQQKAGALLVEASDRIQPGAARVIDEVNRAAAAFRVVIRADHAARLEEHDVDELFGPRNPLAFNGDDIALRINPRRERLDHVTVDRDHARLDELLAAPPRTDARIGERLLQADTAL